MLGQLHDDAHVVFDEEDGGLELLANSKDVGGHRLLLVERHSGHRLVEEKERGLLGDHPRHLDTLLRPVREIVDADAPQTGQVEETEDVLDPASVRVLVTTHCRQPEHRREDAVPALQVATRHDVVEDRLSGEHDRSLEGAGQPHARDAMPGEAGDGSPVEQDLAGRWPVGAGDTVEHAGLPGAIRPDQRGQGRRRHVERHLREGIHAAEPKADVGHDQLAGARHANHLCRRR
nr:hypothetical protein [Nocardioides humi]